jgi:hypothetical protein
MKEFKELQEFKEGERKTRKQEGAIAQKELRMDAK